MNFREFQKKRKAVIALMIELGINVILCDEEKCIGWKKGKIEDGVEVDLPKGVKLNGYYELGEISFGPENVDKILVGMECNRSLKDFLNGKSVKVIKFGRWLS